jgi:hypothetical protein
MDLVGVGRELLSVRREEQSPVVNVSSPVSLLTQDEFAVSQEQIGLNPSGGQEREEVVVVGAWCVVRQRDEWLVVAGVVGEEGQASVGVRGVEGFSGHLVMLSRGTAFQGIQTHRRRLAQIFPDE